MKIGYIPGYLKLDTPSGVLNKINGQTRLWRAMGHEVALFCISPSEEITAEVDAPATLFRKRGGLGRFFDLAPVSAALEAYRPDILYHRLLPYYPGCVSLMRRFPSVIEMNSKDVEEYTRQHAGLKLRYHLLTRKRYISAASGYVAVTHELADYYAEFGKPTLVSANGIDLADFGPPPPSRPGDAPRLVFIGSPGQFWHGIDEILRFAEMEPGWNFDIIGCEPDQLPAAAPGNVRCHGYVGRDAYDAVLRRADIAIGTLALHRKEMEEASPLKVREYLAYGLPTIIGYRDTDFPDDVPYLLKIPNAEGALCDHRDRVVSFVHEWRGRRVDRRDIIHIGTEAKEKTRLEFLEQVLAGTAGRG